MPSPEWACSSVVEHCVDIAGVASSILATPTIFCSNAKRLLPMVSIGRTVARGLEARLQVGLVEPVLLGLFERVGPQTHGAILAHDLAVGRFVEILELEQL